MSQSAIELSNMGTALRSFGEDLRGEREARRDTVANQARHLRIPEEDYRAIEAGRLVPISRVEKQLLQRYPRLNRHRDVLHEARIRVKIDNTPAPPPVRACIAGTPRMPFKFGPALAWCRNREELSQKDIGELLGVTPGAVSHWEEGRHAPIEEHYERLLELFPDLANAQEPDAQDIEKPTGKSRSEDHSPSPFRPSIRLLTTPNQTKPMSQINTQSKETEDQKRHVLNWSKALLAYRDSNERTQQSMQAFLESAHGMGFTIPELLEVLKQA